MKFQNLKTDAGAIHSLAGNSAKSSKVVGWETGTTEIGGTTEIRLGHAQGVLSLDDNTVSINEPLRLGRFIGVWIRKPPFFNPLVASMWDYFFQDKVLSVAGLTDNTISVMERKSGPVNRSEGFAGSYTENNNKFTLKVPEVKGSPVRKTLQYYITAMSDSVTGRANFHEHGGDGQTMRFTKKNYSGDFLYALLGPTMQPDDIEFSCCWFLAFPNIDIIGHLNSGEIGDMGEADRSFEIEFNGTYVNNNTINKIARVVVEAVGLYKETENDIILPSYVYEKFLTSGKTQALAGEYGSNLTKRLARARTDAAADGLVSADEILPPAATEA